MAGRCLNEPAAVRFRFFRTYMEFLQTTARSLLPVAGLAPATHVFTNRPATGKEGVDSRVEPGHGDLESCWSCHTQPLSPNQTAVERARGMTILGGQWPLMLGILREALARFAVKC